jgi:hypothetical protein
VVLISGIGDDPEAFFDRLNKAKLYAVGNPNYANYMTKNTSGTWGPYTYVVESVKLLKQYGKL